VYLLSNYIGTPNMYCVVFENFKNNWYVHNNMGTVIYNQKIQVSIFLNFSIVPIHSDIYIHIHVSSVFERDVLTHTSAHIYILYIIYIFIYMTSKLQRKAFRRQE